MNEKTMNFAELESQGIVSGYTFSLSDGQYVADETYLDMFDAIRTAEVEVNDQDDTATIYALVPVAKLHATLIVEKEVF